MNIETKIKIEYTEMIGDFMDDDASEKDIKSYVEEHICDYCTKHKIHRESVSIMV